jgi:hypothetical protein
MLAAHIFTVILVAARHNCQCQQVKTEYESKKFHGANVGKKVVGCNGFYKALAIALF